MRKRFDAKSALTLRGVLVDAGNGGALPRGRVNVMPGRARDPWGPGANRVVTVAVSAISGPNSVAISSRMTDFDEWNADAIGLVERAIAAHGGLPRWRSTAAIHLPFVDGYGPLLRLKGFGRTFPAPRSYEVRPHECSTLFHGYPDDQHRGRFAAGSVSIENADGRGASIASANHRRMLHGFAKYRRWSPLDALYFFGYALWHYHVVPYTLPRARLLRTLRHHGVVEGVDVLLPPDVITHCRRQQFYFGHDGRIARHDYVAEVVGSWARGSHFWEDYQDAGGLQIARRRRVVVRIGRQPIPVGVLCIQLGQSSTQHGGPSDKSRGSD